jgi:hypothetical protein
VALARLCAKVPGDTRLRAAQDSAAILARAARFFSDGYASFNSIRKQPVRTSNGLFCRRKVYKINSGHI